MSLSPNDYDIVFIKDLCLSMSAGIYEHEKAAPQRVIVNIEMGVAVSAVPPLSIQDVVSYEDVTNEVIALSREQHFDLLETFVERIAALCFRDARVLCVYVRAEKPDIIDDTASVGVQIFRQRQG
ncbi:MAG: dihydroneopterin aldolase [Alphaproteobacteria bacterium]|nr:dihydroneopterin aldolase [Alphaproteobacteria bacterium]